MKYLCVVIGLFLICWSAQAREQGAKLLEPHLHLSHPGQSAQPRVALTFDACMGEADGRILSVLIENRIPATIFVTARWLRRNPQTLAIFLQHPDLFEIENHGANHVPAVDRPMTIYGIAAAGSSENVMREVEDGAQAMRALHIPSPHWFRGSTAKYTMSTITQIRNLGYRIAGYSLNGDGGSLLDAGSAERRIKSAHDGDVIIAHINQPTHSAGIGVVRGILDLKARGFAFVRLEDTTETGDDQTTQ